MRELGLGYCGLDCERCPVFVATAKNDDALRRETAEQWSKLYGEYLADHLGRREFEPDARAALDEIRAASQTRA